MATVVDVVSAARDLGDYLSATSDATSVSETLRRCHALVRAIEIELIPRGWRPPFDWNGLDVLRVARTACEDLRVARHAEFSAVSLDTSNGITVDVALFMCVCLCDRVIGTFAPPIGYTEPCRAPCTVLDRPVCDWTPREVDVATAAFWHNRRDFDWATRDVARWTRCLQHRMAEILTEHVYSRASLESYEQVRVKWGCCVARIKCLVTRQAQWTE